MPATKINLSQMVDLAVGTPEVLAVNPNVLHTFCSMQTMLRQLKIVNVRADLYDIDSDLLSASKAKELSVLSDVDSGRGDDAEDAHSESSSSIPAPRSSTGKRTPYQFLKVKGAKLLAKLRRIRSVPSKNHPFEITRTKNKKKTIGEDMSLNMQLVNRVNSNEKGISKLNDDLMKRLNAMDKNMNEMNERVNTLPSHDDFATIVTRAELEDTLQGIRQDCGNLQQPTERVVIEMSSQTDPVPSRPTSSHSVAHGKMLDKVVEGHGKMLDNIVESHEALTICLEDLKAGMGKKLDQGALDGLNVSSEVLEQLQELKEQVDALAAAKEQISEPLELLNHPPSSRSVSTNEDLQQNNKEMQAEDITNLQMKVSMLENQLYRIQDTINLDDSTKWEISRGTRYEEEISLIFTQNEPDKIRNLAYAVNDQLHDIRNGLYTLDKMLKKNATVQAESADFKDADLDALLKSQDANREEIKRVFACCKELRQSKADKTEVCQKADQMALIDRKTNDILNKMAVNKDNWNEQCQLFSDDINEKLDREELEPLKEALNKLKKENQAREELLNDDAAGIRSDTSKSTERRKGKMAEFELDQNAFKFHFGNGDESLQKQGNANNDYANADNRSYVGQHTTTNPHMRLTKHPHLSNIVFKENEKTNPSYREEVDVHGADGNIYKGRLECVKTKLPPLSQATQDPSSMQKKYKSPQQMRCDVMWEVMPSSDKIFHAPRPPPKNGSYPH